MKFEKMTKVSFRQYAVENGLAFCGTTKQPFEQLAEWISQQPPYNGARDEVRKRADGTLFRKFERDGKTVESALQLDKHATVYRFENGWIAINNQYPATTGYGAWEQTLVYN